MTKVPELGVSRLAGVPTPLSDRIQAALGGGETGQYSARLSAAGCATLSITSAGSRRSMEAALDLLAADALITFACEAAADERDPRAALQTILSDVVGTLP